MIPLHFRRSRTKPRAKYGDDGSDGVIIGAVGAFLITGGILCNFLLTNGPVNEGEQSLHSAIASASTIASQGEAHMSGTPQLQTLQGVITLCTALARSDSPTQNDLRACASLVTIAAADLRRDLESQKG